MADTATLPNIATHGATRLPSVDVDSYNVELKDDEGFIGDRASKGAFRDIIENWRKQLRKNGDDPFGDTPSDEITKKELDTLLAKGDPEAAGILQGAIEDFSQELALVIRRYLKLKGWKDTERIVVGGGFRASRVGELVIGRTAVILKADKVDIDLVADPQRSGRSRPDRRRASGAEMDVQGARRHPRRRHRRHQHPRRRRRAQPEEGRRPVQGVRLEIRAVAARAMKRRSAARDAVDKLADMLERADREGRQGEIALAPFIGIGCPGIIDNDGSIERGAQNLPGNWESSEIPPARAACTRRSPRSATTTPPSSCTTTRWCRA